uniref:Coiled-coil domain containing 33 n=1 Tax=Monopterus albus TaxID=43700 RepID=A0A3Q3QG10_MONAL|nr:coiled-coil domain-containing protein 33 isoform X1 [Monopterus albus]
MKASKKTNSLSRPAAIKLQKDEYSLPSHDALAQILPDTWHTVTGAETELQNAGTTAKRSEATQANKPNINQTYQISHPNKRPPLHDFEDDPHVTEITDLQTKEVESYRSAMSKMADDIIALRTQIVTLEAENSQLRSDLSLHRNLGQDLLDDTDIDVMTKAEISDHIVSLKFKLASETSKAASQRDRIQQLQNELIKKNDSEKELLKLNRFLKQQQHLQHQQSLMAKTATLEVTMKQQEKVIAKMEKALDSKLREKDRQSGNKRLVWRKYRGENDPKKEEFKSALAAENARLREELDRIHQQPTPIIIQQSAQTKEALPLSETLSLLNKLEMAETRVQTLETQLEDNSKLWGRQKQEMLNKLSEHRHGFVRTATTILHNVSSMTVS